MYEWLLQIITNFKENEHILELIVLAVALVVGLATGQVPEMPITTATATTVPSSTITLAPTSTFTLAPTKTSTLIPTSTYTKTFTATKIPTSTFTPVPTFTSTFTRTATLIPTKTATVTNTPVPVQVIYYVSPSGNDSNAGSYAQPWKTIQKAASTLKAGETVLIRGGTYNERIVPLNSGSVGKYITYSAYQGETVVIDGTGISIGFGNGLFYIKDKNYIKVQNITIQKSGYIGLYALGNYLPRNNVVGLVISNVRVLNSGDAAIKVMYSDNLLIENSYTKESGSSGIGVWNSSNVLVDNNTVVNARNLPMPQGHEECITISSTSNFEIRENEVYFENFNNYLGAAGIDIKNSSFDGSVHHNYVHSFYQDGAIYLDAWDAGLNGTESLHDIDIYSNRIEHAGGIAVGSERGGIAENINIYNNIVIDSSWSGIVLHKSGASSGGDGLRKNINIFNNTIFRSIGNGGAGIYIVTANIENIVIKNNIVVFDPKWVGQITLADPSVINQVTADKNLTWGRTLCANDFPNCIELNTGTIRADPMFINTSILDLRLQLTSPAIDQGASLSIVTTDFIGTIRPLGIAYDIGAYEIR